MIGMFEIECILEYKQIKHITNLLLDFEKLPVKVYMCVYIYVCVCIYMYVCMPFLGVNSVFFFNLIG